MTMMRFRLSVGMATIFVSVLIQYALHFDEEQTAVEILLTYVTIVLLLMADVPGAIWRYAIDWRARRRATRSVPKLPRARVQRPR
jgi:hypothetical protein